MNKINYLKGLKSVLFSFVFLLMIILFVDCSQNKESSYRKEAIEVPAELYEDEEIVLASSSPQKKEGALK